MTAPVRMPLVLAALALATAIVPLSACGSEATSASISSAAKKESPGDFNRGRAGEEPDCVGQAGNQDDDDHDGVSIDANDDQDQDLGGTGQDPDSDQIRHRARGVRIGQQLDLNQSSRHPDHSCVQLQRRRTPVVGLGFDRHRRRGRARRNLRRRPPPRVDQERRVRTKPTRRPAAIHPGATTAGAATAGRATTPGPPPPSRPER
jgi:hypothetical protein